MCRRYSVCYTKATTVVALTILTEETAQSSVTWDIRKQKKVQTKNDIYKASMQICVHADFFELKIGSVRLRPVERNYQDTSLVLR